MKKNSILILIMLSFINNSFAITIGEKYFESNVLLTNKTKTLVNNQNSIDFTTDSNGIVNKINYDGTKPINMKLALGNYYESYISAWKNRENKYNHTYSKVYTENLIVTSFGVGGHVYKNEIILIK